MPLSNDITAEMQLPAYTLNPEIVLTPDGPLRGKSIQVEGQKIVRIGDSEAGQGLDLEGYAIVPVSLTPILMPDRHLVSH